MRWLMLLALGMAACSPATEPIDEADDDEGALALGSQLRSDLAPGTYMADDGSTVRIENRTLAQHAALRLIVEASGTYRPDAFVFESDVSTKGTKLLVGDAITPTKRCEVELVKLPAGVAARGTCTRDEKDVTRIDRTFAPRAPAWLVGRYATNGFGLDVTQSSDTSVAFAVTKDGAPLFAHAGGGKYDAAGFAYDATEKSCRFVFYPLRVQGGRIANLTLSATSGPCPFERVTFDVAR